MPKRGDPLKRGFHSRAQWRFFFANPKLRHLARKEAHKTEAAGGGPRVAFRALPKRKGVRRR